MQKSFAMLENVLIEIEDGLKVDVDTEYLADKFNMSQTHLRRLFKVAFGQSLGTYIRSRKMASSIDDLLKTNFNILDIAFEYGLGYEQSYIRSFKREYGLTPGDLRKIKNDDKIKRMSPIRLFDPFNMTDYELMKHDTIKSIQIGEQDGFDFETWKDTGDIAMSLTRGGGFKCKWENAGDAIFRTGKKFSESLLHSQIGKIEVDYGVSYCCTEGSWLGVYGWTFDPLVEYLIVESASNAQLPKVNQKASVFIDGSKYIIYETTRIKKPSVIGINNFKQYWSVRADQRTSGIISVSEHFKAWEKLKMYMGTMYEVAFAVESILSSGTAEVYRNNVTLDNTILGKKNNAKNFA
ncbi:MAG: glycoside hydrolase family 11 protein [Treponema sp.]|nr:glycoside hydrolase family 11 protein [Treponema sp.]